MHSVELCPLHLDRQKMCFSQVSLLQRRINISKSSTMNITALPTEPGEKKRINKYTLQLCARLPRQWPANVRQAAKVSIFQTLSILTLLTLQYNSTSVACRSFFLYIFLSPHALASCWVGIVVDTEKCSSPRWQIWALSVASPPAQNLPTLNVFGANK